MKDLSKGIKKDQGVYHNTKLLLRIYREVVWRVEDSLYDMEDMRDEFGSTSISSLVDFLSIDLEDHVDPLNKKTIEEKLMNIAESKQMIEIVDKSLLKLKTYPERGELYFNILTDTYISPGKLSDFEIQGKYHLSNSSFYRYKKRAIEVLGIIIWGYILPGLRDLWKSDLIAAEAHELYDI